MKVLMAGAGAPSGIDRLARALGWFSLALGVVEVIASRRAPAAVRSDARPAGPGGRIVGDLIDIATLLPALRGRNPQRGRAALTLAAVAGVTLFDILAWRAATRARQRSGLLLEAPATRRRRSR